jgi:putative oxygen-independent coproporphyrinogen III oxidase
MLPLSLYVHIPWCVRKCPYCDFNSHESRKIPEDDYVEALLADLAEDAAHAQGRRFGSVFFGGGTPSLFSAAAIGRILEAADRLVGLEKDCEVTLEANPGTAEAERFRGYRDVGINRLSLGIQSFDSASLTRLGRIHDGEDARRAIALAINAGFDNFNLDLMHGLPDQTPELALADLSTALSFAPPHVSWYQLTIEPNTAFYKTPPTLPEDELLWDIHAAGEEVLSSRGFVHYEVSAFARPGRFSRHNLNYWEFGDYIGIGAGAHGKITHEGVKRYRKTRLPTDYLQASKAFGPPADTVADADLPFEFMMNALRLREGVPAAFFGQRTGLSRSHIDKAVAAAMDRGLLDKVPERYKPTQQGWLFLNDLLDFFLP